MNTKIEPLLTVIIPAYNAEEYIESAINSIQNSTYHISEILVIDDVSTDKTLEIVEKLRVSDKRIKIFKNKKNHKSAGYSRNVGIKKARGKYLTFLDNDDYVLKNHYKFSIRCLEKTKSDFTSSNFQRYRFLDDKKIPSLPMVQNLYARKKTKMSIKDWPDFSVNLLVWTNVFRTDFIKKNRITFLSTAAEDVLFMAKCYKKSNSFDVLPHSSIVWTLHESQQSNSKVNNTLDPKYLIEAMKYRIRADKILFRKIKKHVILEHSYRSGFAVQYFLSDGENSKEYKKAYSEFVKFLLKSSENIFDSKYVPINYKILLYIYVKYGDEKLKEFYNVNSPKKNISSDDDSYFFRGEFMSIFNDRYWKYYLKNNIPYGKFSSLNKCNLDIPDSLFKVSEELNTYITLDYNVHTDKESLTLSGWSSISCVDQKLIKDFLVFNGKKYKLQHKNDSKFTVKIPIKDLKNKLYFTAWFEFGDFKREILVQYLWDEQKRIRVSDEWILYFSDGLIKPVFKPKSIAK